MSNIKLIDTKIDKEGNNSMEIANEDLREKIKNITFDLIGKGAGL